ncbi:TrkA C-terminal domain-containing protein [Halopiger goleimassiliensis]|uniref:TrkA C-terminal domain-containing protein n=1 Tax=Halopiger goleimassiliensis TaxID=1293048 RepID=UPI0006778C63|nr:TrkA C-terminal domain-containing protein [Halopiger goleimassiliensis]
MYAFVSLLVIISLSVLVVRVGTVALTMTGLSREVASFQSLSTFSGAGFTTDEAEEVTAYPSRRRTVKTLMRLGNVGLVSTVASLVVSFTDPVTRLERFVILAAVCLLLVGLARSHRFDDWLTPIIERALSRTAQFRPRDYTGLLNLDRDYRVVDIAVEEGEWLADERIADLELRSAEGVTILGIEREDGTYIGAPGGEHEIRAGDRVIAYGQYDRLQELADRDEDDRAAHAAAKRAHDRRREHERDIDPERSVPSIRE